jgi:hypothetical protein
VMIVPRAQLQLMAAKDWLPISETYPSDRIVFDLNDPTIRGMHIGSRLPPPHGVVASGGDTPNSHWAVRNPQDPALSDRRIRRTHRVTINENRISWGIQRQNGTFDTVSMDVPSGLPFHRGLVVFKTHVLGPAVHYTVHWDNMRFSGPKLAPYENFESSTVINLEQGGHTPVGSTASQTIAVPHVGPNPVILGQTHSGMPGQVLLSINGEPNLAISPHSSKPGDDPCYFGDWRTFRVPLDPAVLRVGENTFQWTVGGGEPACKANQWWHDGFAVKGLEVQFDAAAQ